MAVRGASTNEVEEAVPLRGVHTGKMGRQTYRKNFPFRGLWKGRYYETKQVLAIVVEEPERLVVITIFAFYFGGQEP